MPQAGFEPTVVGVTGFQLNAKRMLYLQLQATMAGLPVALIFKHFLGPQNYKAWLF